MTPPFKGYTATLRMLPIRKQEMKYKSVEFIRDSNHENKSWERILRESHQRLPQSCSHQELNSDNNWKEKDINSPLSF